MSDDDQKKPPKKLTPDEEQAQAERVTKVQGYLRVLKAIKKNGWFWPGED